MMQLPMRLLVSSLAVMACFWGFKSWTAQSQQMEQTTQKENEKLPPYPPPLVTQAEFDRWMKELSNWGRWGKDDQLGAVNLITPDKRKRALALVKDGISVSLAHEMITEKAVDNRSPLEYKTVLPAAWFGKGYPRGAAEKVYSDSFHVGSHIDAICHVFYKGQIYNGFSLKEVSEQGGCAKDGIQNLHNGIITRGVLIDIPRLKGLPYLEPHTPVYPEDIEAWEKKAGVKVGPGDAILLRTGRWARRAKLGPFEEFAGYHATVDPWFKARDVAVVGGDGTQDIGDVPGVGRVVHYFALVGLGAPILDGLDLEAVAETAAKLHRWEFLLTVAPIDVKNGTGSRVNPIATF